MSGSISSQRRVPRGCRDDLWRMGQVRDYAIILTDKYIGQSCAEDCVHLSLREYRSTSIQS